MEYRLNDEDWLDTTKNAERWSTIRGRSRRSLSRLGWASLSYDRTCWNVDKQTYRGCRRYDELLSSEVLIDSDYLIPRRHRVRLTVKDAPADVGCEWTSTKAVFARSGGRRISGISTDAVTADCVIFAYIPYSFDESLNGATVTAKLLDGTNKDGSVSVTIKDLLIVSLGDSFASGEGNPDVPVLMSGLASVYKAFRADEGSDGRAGDYKNYLGLPVRAVPEEPAHWFATGRSMPTICGLRFTLRFRTNIVRLPISALAAVVPRLPKASWATTRARVKEIRDLPNINESQIRTLYRELCLLDRSVDWNSEPVFDELGEQDHPKTENSLEFARTTFICPDGSAPKRQIDYLFMSVGINDVGFIPLCERRSNTRPR